MKVALVIVVAVIFLYGIGFLMTGGDLVIYRFWAPKQENAKRVVFENTQSYVQGKQEYLSRLCQQYRDTASADQKASLRTMILDEASTVDNSKLSGSVPACINALGGGQ
jgi:hypothetical protein